MEEKIKINVDREVYQTLINDAKAFEFFKPNGECNRNKLLNTLIVNFSERFDSREADSVRRISACLQQSLPELSTEERISAARRIVGRGLDSSTGDNRGANDCVISLKPTAKTAGIIDYIESTQLSDCSLSSYFRRMFSAYASLPCYRRERIIFKGTYDRLKEAIERGKRVYVTTAGTKSAKFEPQVDKAIRIISPYSIVTNDEQNHNYLLGARASGTFTMRLNRIDSVVLLDERSQFTEQELANLKWREHHDPQYNYRDSEHIPVRIQLNSKGKMLYEKLYIYRPNPERIEGERNDIFVFDCSWDQLFQYFIRFGHNVTVLEPPQLRAKFERFFHRAQMHYRQLNAERAMKKNEGPAES